MTGDWQSTLDFKLLRVLQLLLTLKSVSRTAEALNQSQPSVSASLRKLRGIFADPLLVRSGSRMIITEHAAEILPSVDDILESLYSITKSSAPFDPGNTRRHVRIVAANCFNIFFLPLLSRILRERAPNLSVEYCAMRSDSELMRDLESGEIDLVIGNWPAPPERLRYAPLLSTDIVCMMRPDHPAAMLRTIDLDTYLSLSHISPSPIAHATVSPIDGRLRELHRERKIFVTVTEYSITPSIVSTTDLVFTTGRPFAEHLAKAIDCRLVDAPPELGRMSFYLLWHERSHISDSGRWLRQIVREVADRMEFRHGER